METSLDNYLKESVSENWEKTGEPFLLSSIGSKFTKLTKITNHAKKFF